MHEIADPILSTINTAPMSERELKRHLRLEVWLWGKQFALRLKTNAGRMRQFLHAGR